MEQQKELKVVKLMLLKYCRKKHKTKTEKLCSECQDLFDYVKLRRSRCIYGNNKPFCSNCVIHCYKNDEREKIKDVMRYSGPRIIFSHPLLVLKHLTETIKYKNRSR